jgi:hypothetical protein
VKRLLFVFLLGCAASGSAAADSLSSISSVVCAGAPQISIEAEAFLFCPGDFSLQGGSISSDLKVEIRSGGALALNDLMITAPFVLLSAETTFTVGSGVLVDVGSGSINVGASTPKFPGASVVVARSGGSVSLSAGTITLAPAIPEPGIWASMLVGLGFIAGLARSRKARI